MLLAEPISRAKSFSAVTGDAGYASRVSSLIPLSVTGVVLFTACSAIALLAVVGIVVIWRGKRGE